MDRLIVRLMLLCVYVLILLVGSHMQRWTLAHT